MVGVHTFEKQIITLFSVIILSFFNIFAHHIHALWFISRETSTLYRTILSVLIYLYNSDIGIFEFLWKA